MLLQNRNSTYFHVKVDQGAIMNHTYFESGKAQQKRNNIFFNPIQTKMKQFVVRLLLRKEKEEKIRCKM